MKDIKTEKGKKINKKSLIVALDVAQEKYNVPKKLDSMLR